ncbi:ATPase, T2SS/T4P/T4SS family [Escherichia coli]|uniref:ATPase, T2SS/T4P/T4SS family n=1 Tax=Escherichia coli TaxID=562 RepID=UPI003AB96546
MGYRWCCASFLKQCPRLDTLGAPPALSELLAEESGLLLVTGATGSGKSTTLAAMVGTSISILMAIF